MKRIAIVVLGLALIGTAEAATAQSVTLTVVSTFRSAVCNCQAAKLSGQISSDTAGEEVVILKQQCGRSFGTADAAAYTREAAPSRRRFASSRSRTRPQAA